MYVEQLSLRSFRNYLEAELVPAPEGITLLRGDNAAGKTNLLEALYYVGNLQSFRRAPAQALIYSSHTQAVLRAAANRESRALLVEIELNLQGREKLKLNRQFIRRREDMLSTVLVTVFSPDDIEIVKGGPQARRDFLDELCGPLHPHYAAVNTEMERTLRQRNALLRSAGGELRRSMSNALDVWDVKFAGAGEEIVSARRAALGALSPEVAASYEMLTRSQKPFEARPKRVEISLVYQQSWEGPLLSALQGARREDVRRGITTVGPQRDEVVLTIGSLSARTQASQGEQRSLALALRLGSHQLVGARQGSTPVLLLDDIFSELDPGRSAALSDCLPRGQALLTSAGPVPAKLPVIRTFLVREGSVMLDEPARAGEAGL